MATYLINSNSEHSAGWYPDDVARVLLAHIGSGWAEAEAPTLVDGGLDVSLLNEDERKQHEAVKAGHVLTDADLHPELLPPVYVPPVNDAVELINQALESLKPVTPAAPSADDPNPGESADTPKE